MKLDDSGSAAACPLMVSPSNHLSWHTTDMRLPLISFDKLRMSGAEAITLQSTPYGLRKALDSCFRRNDGEGA